LTLTAQTTGAGYTVTAGASEWIAVDVSAQVTSGIIVVAIEHADAATQQNIGVREVGSIADSAWYVWNGQRTTRLVEVIGGYIEVTRLLASDVYVRIEAILR
jgi:hypothetical protein